MYLYKTTIFKDTSNVIGASASNDADKSDFETNYKGTALKVDSIEINETTFIIEKSYADFVALIQSPISWVDVRYTESNQYGINLLTENPI